jgi:hypothetical protein
MAGATLSDDTAEIEDRRLKYRALVDYEIAMTQMRFQTLAIFLAAVGFIVGLGHYSRWTGGLLLAITLGLWIIDLRNRDMLSKFRDWGEIVEDGLLVPESRQFRDRTGVAQEVRFGLFFSRRWTIRGRARRLVAFQLGIDIIFLGVIGFAIALLCGVTS